MKKKLATVRTVSISLSAGKPRIHIRRMRAKRLGHVSMTLNEAGKRGVHIPPAQ